MHPVFPAAATHGNEAHGSINMCVMSVYIGCMYLYERYVDLKDVITSSCSRIHQTL